MEKELILATDENNTQKVKTFLDDANENKIVLNINEKNDSGDNPLINATYNNNNFEMVQLLIENANKIILFWK